MAYRKTAHRRRRVRSSRRKNAKSRKVMRGGVDPLANIEKNDLVTVILMDMNQSQKQSSGTAAVVAGDVTCICKVLSILTINKSKVIKLRITNEEFELGRVFGGTDFNNFGIPNEFSKEFEITNSEVNEHTVFPYHFQIYKKEDNKDVVIPNRIYTYAQSKDMPWNGTNTWVIRTVSKITASQ